MKFLFSPRNRAVWELWPSVTPPLHIDTFDTQPPHFVIFPLDRFFHIAILPVSFDGIHCCTVQHPAGGDAGIPPGFIPDKRGPTPPERIGVLAGTERMAEGAAMAAYSRQRDSLRSFLGGSRSGRFFGIRGFELQCAVGTLSIRDSAAAAGESAAAEVWRAGAGKTPPARSISGIIGGFHRTR